MKNLFYSILALGILTSCGHGSASTNKDTASLPPANLPAMSPTPLPQPASANTGTVALNPKHGQPGHRCDIPEGSPLTGTPAPAIANQPPVNPAAVLSQPAAYGTSNVALNPPHGQPGHDCSVEVGKPLKK